MSNWTHVAAIVRVDDLRFDNNEFNAEKFFEEKFGKELRWTSGGDAWEEVEEYPERFLPIGSEGSLRMSVWVNPNKSYTAAYTVSIFGDLRDHDDPKEIVEWFKEKLADIWVRQATITVENEWYGTVNWTWEFEDEGECDEYDENGGE